MGSTPKVPCPQPCETTVWWNFHLLPLLEVLEDPCGANTESAIYTTLWRKTVGKQLATKILFHSDENVWKPMRSLYWKCHALISVKQQLIWNFHSTNLFFYKVWRHWKRTQDLQGKKVSYTQLYGTRRCGNNLSPNMWFHEVRRVKTRLRPMQKVPCTQICESTVCGTIFQQTFGFTNLEVMENLCGELWGKCHIVNSVKQHSGVNLFQRPSDFTNLEAFENPCRQQWGTHDYSTLCHNSVAKPSFITPCFPVRFCHHLQGILTRVTYTLLCKKCGEMVLQLTSSFH